MNVIVTGGAGFIGGALSRRLKEIGHTVYVLDLQSKIEECEVVEGVDYRAGCIADFDTFKALNLDNIDLIFHLASQTSGLISQEDPTLDVDTNVKGTLNVCRFAAEQPKAKIVFTSSMAVYGDYKTAIDEKFLTLPKSNYGASKLSAEAYLRLYSGRGVEYSVLRLFNVYGPGQDLANMKQGMLSIYMTQIIQTGKVDVTGSFERYRDFVYIDDVVNALLLVAMNEECNSEIYNVGTGLKTTVRELLDVLVQESQLDNVQIKNVGGFIGDQFGTFADSEKLKSLGWMPEVTLDKGISTTFKDAVRKLQ